VYGAALPDFTATYSGFVLSQNTNVLTSLATITTSGHRHERRGHVSDYGPVGATSSNYTFSYTAGNLAITQSQSSAVVASSANPAVPGSSVNVHSDPQRSGAWSRLA